MTRHSQSEPADLNSPDLRARAVAAARGDTPFDVLIAGGQLVDMVTGQIRAAAPSGRSRDQDRAARVGWYEYVAAGEDISDRLGEWFQAWVSYGWVATVDMP